MLLFLKYLFERQSDTEETGGPSIEWLPFQTIGISKAKPGEGQEPGTSSRALLLVPGVQGLGCHSAVQQQGAGSEVDQAGLRDSYAVMSSEAN